MDAKTILKEEAEKSKSSPPQYSTERHGGLDHHPGFTAIVRDSSGNVGEGVGRSKKEAEKDAAATLIKKRGV